MSKTHAYRGFEINRGAYVDASDDRIDRWYVEDPDSTTVDRTGPGYATIADAKEGIDWHFRGQDAPEGLRPHR